MASLSMTGKGNVGQIASLLAGEIANSGLSCELVDSVRRTVGGSSFYMMVFEKYYWRASNRASLTVLVSGAGDTVCVDAVGSGGGQGPVFKMSWGAEEDFIGTVADILRPRGFS
ncbi:MAG TPA: DUF6054 family protein [Clostridia bacterium]|nr:DUF6054 family protein [Clostridia bacterium]